MGISSRRQNFENTIIDRQEGDIEGTASEVVDDDLRFTSFLVKPIGDGSGGRFVDDTQNLETRDSARILRRLTLGVVEV